jgi:membrane protease YdiL (CAAX protease family)
MDDPLVARLRGFGLLGTLAILAILAGDFLFYPLSATLVLVWAWLSRTPWPELGFVRPKSWLATLAVAFVFGAMLKLVMKALVMPLLGAPEINQAFHFLVGNPAALPEMLFRVIVGAGIGEEIFYRGYLFERFGKLFGQSTWAKTSTVLLTSIWFGIVHYPFRVGRRPTGAPRRADFRNDLRDQAPDFLPHDRPHRLRPDGRRHHLLGPRNGGRSFHFQIGTASAVAASLCRGDLTARATERRG